MRQNIRNQQQQQILLPTTTGSKQSDEGVVTSGIPVSTNRKNLYSSSSFCSLIVCIYKMISPNQTADGKPPTGNLDQGKITDGRDGAYMVRAGL